MGEIEQNIESNQYEIAIKEEEGFEVKVEAGEVDDNRPLYSMVYLNNSHGELAQNSSNQCVECNTLKSKLDELAISHEEALRRYRRIKYRNQETTHLNGCSNCGYLRILIEKLVEHAKRIIATKEDEIKATLSMLFSDNESKQHSAASTEKMSSVDTNGDVRKVGKKGKAKDIKSLEENLRKKETETEDMRTKISDLQKRNNELTETIVKMNSDNDVNKIDDKKRKEYVEALEQNLRANEAETKKMRAMYLDLQNTNTGLATKVSKMDIDSNVGKIDEKKKHEEYVMSLEQKIREKETKTKDLCATIMDLQQRNSALTAKMANMNTDGEVDKIISHKKPNMKRKGDEMFLIQWKNSWLPAESLNCAKKLKQYRKLNKC